MTHIVTDLEQLPPTRRRSHLDPLIFQLSTQWTELVRGDGSWPEELGVESFRRSLLRCGGHAGISIETTTRMGGRRVVKESPERLWARVRENR